MYMKALDVLQTLVEKKADVSCEACEIIYEENSCPDGCFDAWKILADDVAAELAAACDVSARDGMAVIAEAEGWPALRDGESVTEWMGRCWLPRPRYEDGSLVEIGGYADDLESKIEGIEVTVGILGKPWYTLFDDTGQIEGNGPFKRPSVEVLGADGLPINVGDTVWLDREYAWRAGNDFYAFGGRCGLYGVGANDALVVKQYRDASNVEFEVSFAWCPASWLTHDQPDTLAAIAGDITMAPAEYCAVHGLDLGDDPDREKATVAMISDLLRRQRELDTRMGGAE